MFCSPRCYSLRSNRNTRASPNPALFQSRRRGVGIHQRAPHGPYRGPESLECTAVRNPTVLVLLGLAVVWALVLTPDLLRVYRRSTSRRSGGLGRVAPPTGRAGAYAGRTAARRSSRAQAQQRRALVLYSLGVAAVTTFVVAMVVGGLVWLVHVVADLALVAFVVLLASQAQRSRELERSRRARSARRETQAAPSYMRRRPAAEPGRAVGEVYYLDDVRPGHAVAGYVEDHELAPSHGVSAYGDYDEYEEARFAQAVGFPVDADPIDAGYAYDDTPLGDYEQGGGYAPGWAEDERALRRSVGW